ncbi:cryptochrome/photolyase family protein [Cryptosporangium arvum]|uniref:Deoxyribodipyrimidine photolyase n=1 Tax=Cryptosporangium arvum DSM 44712 TaxID=927661 RepID=A0A011ABW8_9ACTN|nr:deoxyribodipyrimidine photo-lyase [Cryptosporangium arvum]EXG79526.1 deoxyribodipyrimidine photolyase [Cryptosporangium arvum DSM 44712]
MPNTVFWFRRDLRLIDNPALLEAVSAAGDDGVRALFVLDPVPFRASGGPRTSHLARSLRALDDALGGALLIRHGDPVTEVPRAAAEIDADEVYIAADYGPYGSRRDQRVEKALLDAGATLHRTGSPYAVAPGRVRKPDGTPYRVFTPFSKAWRTHGWRGPVDAPKKVSWLPAKDGDGFPDVPDLPDVELPEAGEDAARERLAAFLDEKVRHYKSDRNRPDHDGTSRLSVHLKYGELHPRTILAELAKHRGEGADTFRNEICWRDFYADVMFHRPESVWESLDQRVGSIETDSGKQADERFEAWAAGRTGFPIVDAGMRQLLSVGWMHNRVRMITASFLVKDLHLPWQRGAAHFLDLLVDGDYASNNHGWQWVAGTGTDAAPYIRVFNPVTQGKKFDPDGGYVRRWVPELAEVSGAAVHEPWTLETQPEGYPEPIVDHAAERKETLDRFERVRR